MLDSRQKKNTNIAVFKDETKSQTSWIFIFIFSSCLLFFVVPIYVFLLKCILFENGKSNVSHGRGFVYKKTVCAPLCC